VREKGQKSDLKCPAQRGGSQCAAQRDGSQSVGVFELLHIFRTLCGPPSANCSMSGSVK